ncbi:hypothetical protein GCM10010402_14000 [Actinomadura luteofluorescens]
MARDGAKRGFRLADAGVAWAMVRVTRLEDADQAGFSMADTGGDTGALRNDGYAARRRLSR